MDQFKQNKLDMHSKSNRINNMIAMRARNQNNNVIQTEYDKHTRIPLKKERHETSISIIHNLPIFNPLREVNLISEEGTESDNFIIG